MEPRSLQYHRQNCSRLFYPWHGPHTIEFGIWEDLLELDGKMFALSYNHGIYQLLASGELKKVKANQTLPTRFFTHNNTTYAFGREGICRINPHDLTCKQISAGVTGKFINVTSNGIYYTNPHGVWMLDERALVAEPNSKLRNLSAGSGPSWAQL